MADLGISADKLERSHKKVNDLAKTVAKSKGLSAPVKITAESAATPEAEHTLRLAELGAQMKVTAVKGEGHVQGQNCVGTWCSASSEL